MENEETKTNDAKNLLAEFEKSRNNLLAVIIFTVINMGLILVNSDVSFLFSATMPQLVIALAQNFASEWNNNTFITVGIIITLIVILPYIIFWILSKHFRGLMLAALIYFGIDTLALIVLILLGMEFNFSILLEIAFHCWVLYYLYKGVLIWNKIKKLDPDEINSITNEKKIVETSLGKKNIFENIFNKK